MKKFVKNYVGKGKQHENLDIVTVSFDLEELAKFAHEYEGKKYVTVEISKLKQADKYGRTHTAYVNKLEAVKEQEDDSKKNKSRKKQTAEV